MTQNKIGDMVNLAKKYINELYGSAKDVIYIIYDPKYNDIEVELKPTTELIKSTKIYIPVPHLIKVYKYT